MKKMLYIMGIEWNWIFQRPQVLALELEKDYALTVVGTKQPIHAKYQNNRQPENLRELYQIPFQEKNRLIGAVARHMHTRVLGDVSAYDIIWVGYPLFGRYIPEGYRGTVVYDCMDNFEALYQDRKEKNLHRACAEEQKLLRRADLVFASSLKLREKLLDICPDKEVIVIRNGYNSSISTVKPALARRKEQYVLGYIGTLSGWFDTSLIVNSLRKYGDIRYDLIGPVADHQPIQDEKVNYRGVIEHSRLGTLVSELDCLIMPFQINDIILYVDPVKLYEYIAWGKCIIACWYPEIDRFQEFVYFYHDEREYLELIDRLKEEGFPAKFTQDMQEKFLAENSWDARVQEVKKCLESCVLTEFASNAKSRAE